MEASRGGGNSSVVESFNAMMSSYENETKALKSIAALRGVTSPLVAEQCSQMEQMLSALEGRMSELDAYMDEELSSLTELKKLNELAKQQNIDVENAINSTPACFLVDNKPLSSVSTHVAPKTGPAAGAALPSFTGTSVEEADFLKVPTATRGRLTLAQVNVAWITLCKLFDEKHKSSTSSGSGSGSVLSQSAASTYVTETEVRNSSIYESGNSTGKAILHTLRALSMIKVIMQRKEPCYYKVTAAAAAK